MAEPQRRHTDDPATDAAPGDRRRSQANDTPHRRRKNDLLRKYRQPLIGLGLVGAAMPLVNATTQASDPAKNTAAPAPGADQASAANAGADAEEALVGKIAASRASDARQGDIEAAMTKFKISEELATDIYDIAQQEGLDTDVAYGLVRTESTFNDRAVSHVGARGLTQVMPRTARWLVPGTSAQDLFDRKTNLKLGFKYLTQLVDKYSGDMKLALLAYNRGPGTVDKVLKKGGNPDNGYAAKVMGG
jgi:soluble lytic murein transglycosylase-like protein